MIKDFFVQLELDITVKGKKLSKSLLYIRLRDDVYFDVLVEQS